MTAAPEPPRAADVEIEGLDVEPGGLTADETARRALAVSPSMQEKRAEIQAANARIAQTTIQALPQLTLRAIYTRLSPVANDFGGGALVGARNPGQLSVGTCPGGAGQCVLDAGGTPVAASPFAIESVEDNYVLNASLNVPLSDYALQVAHAAAAASASRDAARFAVQAERAKVETEARILYYNFVRAHGQVFIASKALERNRARLEDARTAFTVGTVSKADVLRLEALVANTELALAQAESLRALTVAELAIVMEDRSGRVYKLGEGIAPAAAPRVDAATTRRLVADAMRNRLELRTVDATARSFRRGEQAVRAGSWPKVEAIGDVTYARPNPRFFAPTPEWNATWSVSLVARWNVGDSFLNDARGDELAANAEATRGRRRLLEGAIAHEVVTAHLDVGKARAALSSSETAVRAAEEAYRVTTDLYRAGRATTTDLIEAESELLDAKLGYTNARIDLTIAALRLGYATGRGVRVR